MKSIEYTAIAVNDHRLVMALSAARTIRELIQFLVTDTDAYKGDKNVIAFAYYRQALMSKYVSALPKSMVTSVFLNKRDRDMPYTETLGRAIKAGANQVQCVSLGVILASTITGVVSDEMLDESLEEVGEEASDMALVDSRLMFEGLVQKQKLMQELVDGEVRRILAAEFPAGVGREFSVLDGQLTAPVIMVASFEPNQLLSVAEVEKQGKIRSLKYYAHEQRGLETALTAGYEKLAAAEKAASAS